jgi:hypothetical protein
MPYSPAQMLMGILCRTLIPTQPSQLQPTLPKDVIQQLENCQNSQKFYYDRNTVPKNEFLPGQSVYVQKLINNDWTPGIIAEKHSTPRSYIVSTEDGDFCRNSRHILKSAPMSIVPHNELNDNIPNSASGTNDNKQTFDPPDETTNEHLEPAQPGTPLRQTRRLTTQPHWHKDYVM